MDQHTKTNRLRVLTQHKQARQPPAFNLACTALMGQLHSLRASMRGLIPLYVSSLTFSPLIALVTLFFNFQNYPFLQFWPDKY